MLTSKWLEWANNVEGAMLSSDAYRAIAKRFWGSELAADFSTYEGKAFAAMKTQDRETAKECLILCDFLWPIIELASTEDHVGDPTLESKFYPPLLEKRWMKTVCIKSAQGYSTCKGPSS